MTSKCTRIGVVFVIGIGLASCSEPEQNADISRDQLNHYAGIETHDHPVDNASSSHEKQDKEQKDKDRR